MFIAGPSGNLEARLDLLLGRIVFQVELAKRFAFETFYRTPDLAWRFARGSLLTEKAGE